LGVQGRQHQPIIVFASVQAFYGAESLIFV